MEREQTSVNRGRLLVGVVILAIGVFSLTGNLVDIRFDGWHELWPLILVAFGLYRFSEAEEPRRKHGGLVLAAVGLWLLISTGGYLGLGFETSWPLLLLLIGAARVAHPADRRRTEGVFLILLGSLFQLIVLGIWGLDWQNAWPLALVCLGIFVIWRALSDARRSTKKEEFDHDSH